MSSGTLQYIALSSATPLPGALARNDLAGHGQLEDLGADRMPGGVRQVDEFAVQAQVEGVDPRRRCHGAGPRPRRPSGRRRRPARRPPRSASSRCSNQAAAPGPSDSSAAVPSGPACASRHSPQPGQRVGRVEQPVRARQVGQHVVHQVPDRDRVRRTAGVAHVVLEHPPAAELVADQVEAHDRRPDRARPAAGSPRDASRVHRRHARGAARRRPGSAARRRRRPGTPRSPAPAGSAPRTGVCHSCGLISRGTRSTAKRRFSPSTPNVMPVLLDPVVAARSRLRRELVGPVRR